MTYTYNIRKEKEEKDLPTVKIATTYQYYDSRST